jgi:hypothetical protein
MLRRGVEMNKVLSSAMCLVWLLVGCGEVTVVNTSPDTTSPNKPDTTSPNNLGGEGASCVASTDCKTGLSCLDGICVDETKGGSDESCTKTADCQLGLKCLDSKCADLQQRTNPGEGPCEQGDCPPNFIDDGVCDLACNCEQMGYDGQDCWDPCGFGYCPLGLEQNGQCDDACNCQDANFDGGDCDVPQPNCDPQCSDMDCCGVRINGWDPMTSCAECDPSNLCSPGTPGYDDATPCTEQAGTCSPNLKNMFNQKPKIMFNSMAACGCQAPGDFEFFVDCALPDGAPTSDEDAYCLECFFGYFMECIVAQCNNVCTICEMGAALVSEPDSKCNTCMQEAGCGQILTECTGGVVWFP